MTGLDMDLLVLNLWASRYAKPSSDDTQNKPTSSPVLCCFASHVLHGKHEAQLNTLSRYKHDRTGFYQGDKEEATTMWGSIEERKENPMNDSIVKSGEC